MAAVTCAPARGRRQGFVSNFPWRGRNDEQSQDLRLSDLVITNQWLPDGAEGSAVAAASNGNSALSASLHDGWNSTLFATFQNVLDDEEEEME
ncbi:uncharacterized protein LOC123397433 isoform X2 [Hordeum vulgare subsp. vulgare]|uniref:uncharacterized protein LOC123397433 isoform X2 n=1 Tax=Hordeum vulgare subsp. vulgare TaxID=112509 RepID=UPI001D1A4E49|nr:uncharacterized protein LOC123397433 isoform X2 [Hordeum vulgare subsp. vulgare]